MHWLGWGKDTFFFSNSSLVWRNSKDSSTCVKQQFNLSEPKLHLYVLDEVKKSDLHNGVFGPQVWSSIAADSVLQYSKPQIKELVSS